MHIFWGFKEEQLHQGSLVLRPGAQFYGVFQLGLG
jgi:hypothetical protein